MKIFSLIFGSKKKKEVVKTISEYQSRSNRDQQEILIKQGREQFKKLVDRGLGVPVALL